MCTQLAGLKLVGLYSRPYGRKAVYRASQHQRRYFSTAARVYSSLDACSTVRASTDATCLKDLPADAPLDARTRRLNHPRHVVSLHVPSLCRRACGRPCNLAHVSEEQTPRVRCADAPTRQHGGHAESSSPERSPRRDRHRARDRRSAAAGRAGLPLPLSVCLPSLGRSTTRSTVVVK